MPASLPARLLLGCLLATPPLLGHAADQDTRNTIVLKSDERAAFLRQMRTMLEGLQQILQSLGDEDLSAVARTARSLGTPLAETIPASTMQRLPTDFQRLAIALHTDFQQIALDADSRRDERLTSAQLSAALAKCLACHRAYRVEVE